MPVGGQAGSTSNSVTGSVDESVVVQARDIGSVTINSSRGPRWRHRTASIDDSLAAVRAKVVDQWQHEVGRRGLEQPRPVRLRWRPPSRPMEVSSPREPLRGALGQDVTDSLPVAHELVEAFRADSRRQLVVLGAPGAGKTILAILYTLAAAARPDHPVPVLLSIAGWRPRNPNDATGEPIEAWVARRIADDHPELADGADGLRRLWAGKRLLPVLDGLDEMPEPMLAHALTDLDRSAGAGLDMVLTCRTTEYERGFATGNALSHAAVVDIEPVAVDDAAVYLTQRETTQSRRWDGAVELMRREPDGPLAAALSTPLMISLARQVYRDPASDPTELTRFGTADAAGQHLLTQFLPSVYPRERERVRSTRWLSFLAHHLRDRIGDPNYEWWRLSRSVPAAVIASTIVATATVLGAVLTPTLTVVLGSSRSFTELLLPGMVVGAVVGVMAAPRALRPVAAGGQVTGIRLLRRIGAGVAQDITTLLTAASAISAATLGIGYLAARPAAIATDFAVVEWWRGLWSPGSGVSFPTLLVAFVVLGVITMINGLGAFNGGLPQRSTPRLRLLAPSLAVGLVIGMAAALPLLVLGLSASLGPFGEQTWFGFWVLVAGSVGVPIGLARWLAAPAEHQESSSPQNLLRWDRRALLVTVTATAVVGGVTTALASMAFPVGDRPPILPMSLVIGVVIGGVVLIGSGTAWLTYTVARGWLAMTGRLPWRLNRFLRTAHVVGVLRQTGPAYQLRHDLLTNHLAGQWPAAAGPDATRRPVRRRWGRLPSLVVLVASIVLLAAAIPAIYLANAPHRLDGPATDGRGMVLSLDGRTLAAFDPGSGLPIVRLWDVRSGHLKATLRVDPRVRDIAGIGLNADGTELTLITGDTGPDPAHGLTGSVWRWRTEPDRQARELPGAAGQLADTTVVVMAFTPDGNTLAIGRRDGTVQLWDLNGDHGVGERIRPRGPATPAIRNLAYSVDGRLLAVRLDDGSVAVVEPATRAVTRTLPAGSIGRDDGGLQLFAVGEDGRRVATVDSSGVAALWNLDDGRLVRQLDTGRTGFLSVALSSDGSTVAIGADDGSIELRDLAADDVTGTLEPTPGGDHAYRWLPQRLVFAPDDRSLAATSLGNSAQVWGTPAS